MPSTAITAVHVSNDAREWPSVGLPTVTMTATEAASSAAHVHSHRVTRRCVSRALIGRANSSDVTSSACTSSTDPKPSAAACNANPTAATRLPSHHWPSRSSRSEQLDVADLFVRDLVRLTLVDDVADRDEQGSAEGEQGGDIRPVIDAGHRYPP